MQTSILPFLDQFQSAVIGTLDDQQRPFSSYAPYLHYEHRYYVFISDIATHAQNLRCHPYGSLFFIEDESKTENMFARKRLSLQCHVEKVDRESPRFDPVITAFKSRFGMIGMLQQMQDFNLYVFEPLSGEATFGFGEAYTLGGDHMERLIPRTGGSGHRQK